MLRFSAQLLDRNSSRKLAITKLRGRTLKNRPWYLNETATNRLGGADNQPLCIAYTNRPPMVARTQMKRISRASANDGQLASERKLVDRAWEKNMPDYVRPSKPTIWEKEEWLQYKLPAEMLPEGPRGKKFNYWVQDDRHWTYEKIMNRQDFTTKNPRMRGIYYSFDQRWDTKNEGLPDASFDITKVQADIDRWNAGTKKVQELKEQGDFTTMKRLAPKNRYYANTLDTQRTKFINWNAAVGRRKTELERWRDDRVVPPEKYKAVKE